MSKVSNENRQTMRLSLTRQTRRCPKCGSRRMRATKLAFISPSPHDELDPILFECPECGHTKDMDRSSRKSLLGLGIAFIIMISICGYGLISGQSQLVLGAGAFSALILLCFSEFIIVQWRYPVTGEVAPAHGVDIDIPEKGLYVSTLVKRRCRKCLKPSMEALGAERGGWGKNEMFRCTACRHEHVIVKIGGANLSCATFLCVVGGLFFMADAPNPLVYTAWGIFFVSLLVWFNKDDWFLYPEVSGGEDGT